MPILGNAGVTSQQRRGRHAIDWTDNNLTAPYQASFAAAEAGIGRRGSQGNPSRGIVASGGKK